MGKRMICLLMAAALCAGMAPGVLVHAEGYKGSKSWRVNFDGSRMDSNFSSSEMAEEIYSIQPGDTMELQVVLENSGGQATDWYMTNEVLATLEDSQEAAGGGAYTYRLAYVGPDEVEDVLYNSENVGGEDTPDGADEGLRQATDSLEDYFLLGTLEDGQEGSVMLRVGLDGESQGNTYQDTLAKLQMNFAVEKAQPQETTATVTPEEVRVVERQDTKEEVHTVERQDTQNVVNKVEQQDTQNEVRRVEQQNTQNAVRKVLEQDSQDIIAASVKTGDPTQVLPYCMAALVAGIVLLVLGARAILRRHTDTDSGKGGGEDEES